MTQVPGWSPAFQLDTDTVGAANRADITVVNTGGPSGGPTVTITTAAAHGFRPGWEVLIVGLTGDYEIINGAYPIATVPSTTTFTFALVTTLASRTYTEGVAFSPAPSYIRYAPHDTFIEDLASHATLHVEPWDYNTVRVLWGVDTPLDARATRDIDNGRIPLVVVTRSGFGYPSTPLDGVTILSGQYEDFVATATNPRVTQYIETMPANPDNDWDRPVPDVQGLYDRNLTPGHWYYYSVFFYIGAYDDNTGAFIDQEWVRGATMDALTPINEHHAERLYDLIPEYYQGQDQEFTAGTGRRGVVERFLQTIGFEVDYTKTLADGIEHIYDIDHVHDDLLHCLGVFNFGVAVEDSLGDIRYRSLLATITNLYEIRGSQLCLQRMTNAATKYRSKVIEGPNLMNLTDDAEFASGTGSWGNPLPEYALEISKLQWLGHPTALFNPAHLQSVSLLTTPEGGSDSLVPRRNAMLVGTNVIPSGFDDPGTRFDAPIPFDGAGSGMLSSVLIACGVGQGFVAGRRHEELTTEFYPRLHGIRCAPSQTYTFSGYSVLGGNPATPGKAAVGIMWFNDVTNGNFDFTSDYLTKAESTPQTEAVSTIYARPGPFRRFFVTAQAPLSMHGENYVYAVPYWIFPDFQGRYVSACMLHAQGST